MPMSQPTSTVDILAQALLNANLPKPELKKFDGDVKTWANFYSTFYSQIGGRAMDPAQKLTLLQQHCTGEAYDIIAPCALLPPSIGYDEAIRTLSERFGSKHMVAGSYITDLKTGPRVAANNVEGLLKFADQLNVAYIVLSQLDYTSDVNSTDTIGQCVRRLPQHLQTEWVKQAARITLEQAREPQFYDLVKFVKA